MQPRDSRRQPALPAALPRLDLSPAQAPAVVPVLLKTSRLEAGVRTQTCPQCGQSPAAHVVQRRFEYVPPWVYVGLLANIFVVLFLYALARRVVKAELSLCAGCDAADRRARRLRSFSVAGVVAFPLVLGGLSGLLLGVGAGILGATAGIVSGIVGVIATHRATRGDAITCTFVDKKAGLTTLRAADTFAGVLAAEAPDALG